MARIQILTLPDGRWALVLDGMPALSAEAVRDDWLPARQMALDAGASFVWRFDHRLDVAGGEPS